MRFQKTMLLAAFAAGAALFAGTAVAQEKHYRFAYDQPRNTGYSIAGDLFAESSRN